MVPALIVVCAIGAGALGWWLGRRSQNLVQLVLMVAGLVALSNLEGAARQVAAAAVVGLVVGGVAGGLPALLRRWRARDGSGAPTSNHLSDRT